MGVLASGNGTNLQAILDAVRGGEIPEAQVRVVISNKPTAYALERAKRAGVEALFVDPAPYPTREAYHDVLSQMLKERQVHLLCLAGYLLKISAGFLQAFRGRILNIHPALLPKFGGPGMYGLRVHDAVLRAGETETGATVHVVDEEYDHGAIVAQVRVPVLKGDTPETLAARVLEQEHKLYPQAIRQFCEKIRSSSVSSPLEGEDRGGGVPPSQPRPPLTGPAHDNKELFMGGPSPSRGEGK